MLDESTNRWINKMKWNEMICFESWRNNSICYSSLYHMLIPYNKNTKPHHLKPLLREIDRWISKCYWCDIYSNCIPSAVQLLHAAAAGTIEWGGNDCSSTLRDPQSRWVHRNQHHCQNQVHGNTDGEYFYNKKKNPTCQIQRVSYTLSSSAKISKGVTETIAAETSLFQPTMITVVH